MGFIDKVKDGAIEGWKKYKVLPSLTIAQAILESGWGKSGLSLQANNLFGVKAFSYPKYVTMPTKEFINGKYITINDRFRKYNTWNESIEDHAKFLIDNKRYKNLIGVKDYKKACELIQQSGYATEPNYAKLLIQLIEQNQLYKFDNIQDDFISLDGGGYASYNGGAPGINLIIRDYSKDIVRVFAWVDSDKGASWAFDITPINSNYTVLKKNTNKVITQRNGGYTFSKGSNYKITAKGYDNKGEIIAQNTINIKIPN